MYNPFARHVTCARRGKVGHLHPLRIPLLPFDIVTLDLITGLPQSENCDAVLLIINKLTKFTTYLPTSGSLNQQEFAKLFMTKIARRYGLPTGMVADRDP
jgi:hypothetical protein